MKHYQNIAALACGLLFGFGLQLSGMANPAKVVGFLNVTGQWDPSLLFVMAGAIAVYLPVYFFYIRPRVAMQKTPVLAEEYRLPVHHLADKKLVIGSAIFGFGWGMVGICPGPALTSLFSGQWLIALFVLSMITGIFIACRVLPRLIK